MMKHITVRLRINNYSAEEATIINNSLKPDNLANPPMKISSNVKDKVIEIVISNLQGSETTISTVNDLLDSYQASQQVLEKTRNLV